MRIWSILTLFLIILAGCTDKEAKTYFTSEKAVYYFGQVEKLCNDDGGRMWGKQLYGPMMFVDRPTRKIFANMPDRDGLLKLKDGVYTGSYPRELIIDNINVEYGGTMYGMAPLPPREDTARIVMRAIHGLFHVYQKNEGFNPTPVTTKRLDEKNARLWLKLELRALRQAIDSSEETRSRSIRDALIFRGARRELDPLEIKDENRFEFYEGLATLTFISLYDNDDLEVKKNLHIQFDRMYWQPIFSRTYGFANGAAYGYLATRKGYDLRSIKSDTTDLALIVKDSYAIKLPERCLDVAGSIAMNYELDSIYKEEEKRMTDIKERVHRQISDYTEKPVVYLELESPYFDFEPEEIRALDTLGTIYNSIRVADNWGKLTVDKGGCLVSFNLKSMRVKAKNLRESKNHYYGDGWHLILNSDWEIVRIDENYFVRKLMP
ncbi:MAG: hypothetical protein U0X39_06365 [Bacteroidales bacterium]